MTAEENMKHVVLFRGSLAEEGELSHVRNNFDVHTSRMTPPSGSCVIGRYSVLPYYDELEKDLQSVGSRLINARHHHDYVADLGSYVPDLGSLTPTSWSDLSSVPKDAGPFVLKGATNSKKHQWKTHMYAADWHDAVAVYLRLSEDGIIGNQKIYIRKYVPLARLGTTMTGLPLTKEFRFFVLNDVIVGGGFYWDTFMLDIVEQGHKIPTIDEVPKGFMDDVLQVMYGKVPFYVVDVAQDIHGRWWVIELNDGQMSGLSGVDPGTLYANMKTVLTAGSLPAHAQFHGAR